MKNISEPEDWQKIPEEGDEPDLPWSGSFSWTPFLDLNLNDPLLSPKLYSMLSNLQESSQ